MTTKGTLYIISAPSGAGKTTLIKKLLPNVDKLMVSVSHTTRPQREGEQDGIHYFFTSVDSFTESINQGEFFEYAQVFNNFYGTSQAAVDKNLNAGIDVILEIDWQGAQQIRAARPDCQSIFILPPSIEALQQRLNNRGKDAQDIIDQRMQEAVTEMQHYAEYDFLIINDDFKTALAQLKTIILAQRLKSSSQHSHHQSLLSTLLN